MFGYKVRIGKERLPGGERFWATIQKALDYSIKVLFVYSKNIVTTDGNFGKALRKSRNMQQINSLAVKHLLPLRRHFCVHDFVLFFCKLVIIVASLRTVYQKGSELRQDNTDCDTEFVNAYCSMQPSMKSPGVTPVALRK